MLRFVRAAACLAALITVPCIANAQLSGFNVAAGASFPSGDFGNYTNTGWLGLVGVGIRPALSPIGFRAEAMYNQFSNDCGAFEDYYNCGDDKPSVWGVTANALYNLPIGTSTAGTVGGSTLYAIGGLGLYGTHEPFYGSDQTNVGWNIGAGFRFPLTGFSAYVEVRYHYVSNADVRFVPLVFGLSF